MYNMRKLIQKLEKENEIVRITSPVNVDLELAEIHRRVIAADGPALLFENVHQNGIKSPFRVLSNVFGSKLRINMAFGEKPENIIKDLTEFAYHPPNLKNIFKFRSSLFAFRHLGSKTKKNAPILAHNNRITLDDIPFIKSWTLDGGFFATLPLVYTEDPDNHSPNLGMYRLHRYDANHTGVHWQINKGGGFHYFKAEQRNEALPVTVFLGGPPALILSAIAPLPENVNELLLASLLLGKKIKLTKKVNNGHPLIAEAEFALVGNVAPLIRKPEGPFGDHYGYYSLQHDYPVFNVTNIFHREDAILPVTVVGKPKQEDFFIGDYLQDLLSPLYPIVMPGVKALWSYGETGHHSLSAAVLKERYPREAMASAFAIMGQGQLSLTKFLIAVDRSLDLTNFRALLSYVLSRVDYYRDLYIFDNLSMDTLDYTGPEINKGSKAILLGMGEPIRELLSQITYLPAWVKEARVFTEGCLVIDTGKNYSSEILNPTYMVKEKAFQAWPLIILVDNAKEATKTVSRFLWTAFTRFEPAADIYFANQTIERNSIKRTGPILFDCRMKPPYPQEVFCDPETAKLVTKRWKEYFPNGMDMGNSDSAHLDFN